MSLSWNDIDTRFDVLVADLDREGQIRWYLALNGGGTPHTAEELERVRRLLET